MMDYISLKAYMKEGINFSAKSANDAGISFDMEFLEKLTTRNTVIINVLISIKFFNCFYKVIQNFISNI